MNRFRPALALSVFVMLTLGTAATLRAADTFKWDGKGSNNDWEKYNNWLKNGSGSHTTRPQDSNDIAAVKFISGRKNNPRLEKGYTIRMLRFLNSNAVKINDDNQWNGGNGSNRRTLTITGHQVGSNWTAVDVDSNPSATVTHTIEPGVQIKVNNNRYWDIGGDEKLNVKGRVAGTGRLTKNGTGTLLFSNTGDYTTNTYTGNTVVDKGVLQLNKKNNSTTIRGNLTINNDAVVTLLNDHQIANASTVTLNSTATLDVQDENDTIANLSVASGASVTGTTGVLTVTGNTSGSGTIATDMIVNAGSTLAPGSSIGDMDFDSDGSLTMNGTLETEVLEASIDRVLNIDELILGGSSVLDIVGTLTEPIYTIMTYNTRPGGTTFGDVAESETAFYVVTYDDVSGRVLLVYTVPEPSTFLLAVLALLGLCIFGWRRTKTT